MAQREIWFKCSKCGRESYCGSEFDQYADPDVMCPFCGEIMKLAQVRIS